MSARYPAQVFRRFSKQSLRQGDIAIAEFHQLRRRSGDRAGPGPEAATQPNLPYIGQYVDNDLQLNALPGARISLVVRIWRGLVIVLHQNCEIDFCSDQDSRLVVAPLVSEPQWPEGPWAQLRENLIPGYFYVPAPSADNSPPDLGLSEPLPESVVAFASMTLSSVGVVQPRRQVTLAAPMLEHLQDAISRFFTVRGFATLGDLTNLVGKRLATVSDSGLTVSGPSRLLKVHFGANPGEADDGDDEATVAYWGVRPT